MGNALRRRAVAALLAALVGVALAALTTSPNLALEGEIELPPDYDYELVYRPTLAGLTGIVSSYDGTIYVRHLGETGGVTVSQLDVDEGELCPVLELEPEVSASHIIGGPEETFFISVNDEWRQYSPDEQYQVWSNSTPAGYPKYYSEDGRMLGVSNDDTAVLELWPDGSSQTLLGGLGWVYDIVTADDGLIFISDIEDGKLISLDATGTHTDVIEIAKDNTDLVLDHSGNLYFNNADERFARVDVDTGEVTEITADNAECQVIKSPADLVFDLSERVIFASWVDSMITWADISTGDGGWVIDQPWANTKAADIGPDQYLYLGVNGCGSSPSSQIESFDATGAHTTRLAGLEGTIWDLAFDSTGGLYFALTTPISTGVSFLPHGAITPTLVPISPSVEMGSLAVDPTTDHAFGYAGQHSLTATVALIVEFTGSGKVADYQVSLPKEPMEVCLDCAPDGTLYAFATEKERFTSGPKVDRWILRLDLTQGTSETVAHIERDGCCPMGAFSIDAYGYMWWILNPDFLLYQIPPGGEASLFASNLPIDPGYADRNMDGEIFLNTPEGLYRMWMWATHRAHLPLCLR
jgi:hypothetical protein